MRLADEAEKMDRQNGNRARGRKKLQQIIPRVSKKIMKDQQKMSPQIVSKTK